jgi:hypothetical protein
VTPGKAWRFRRDVLIYCGHLQGIPQRTIADAADVPQSSVPGIVRKMAAIWPPDLKTDRKKNLRRAKGSGAEPKKQGGATTQNRSDRGPKG